MSETEFDPALLEAVRTLNNAHEVETSWLEPDDLQRLIDNAYFVEVVDEADAFLIAMNEQSDHDGINFAWFKERYDQFVYIDRIVTANHARGQGLAKSLYEALFEAAKADGQELVGCEINRDPPNPGSEAYHTKLGFEMIDERALPNGKTVGYWIRKLT
ncbi:GNAT family N-acetyltransferase [Maritalea mediterranea]|uniref:GNAT family N-acetyltransferase n=1 Tax=Maritalea mediterranea TaxID=2909667 RepID=A0ABS9EBB8_9HYPH|nr:GNAT family N-acetyltransferase [Maritalea mediterranea]MCF4099487.1 GNAT family N-acetyltransferase [Maritalea mediterranea]